VLEDPKYHIADDKLSQSFKSHEKKLKFY